MLEAGRLTKAVPVKNEDGRLVTRVIEQEGPIADVESTTLGEIFEEDRNRCLLMATGEREEQTRRVLTEPAARATGRPAGGGARRVAVRHCPHRMLPRRDVVTPFAEEVAARLAARVEARRDFSHLLRVVKASALLHHRRRDRDAAGNVVAAVAGYQVAEHLARDPLAASATGVNASARKFLAVVRQKLTGPSSPQPGPNRSGRVPAGASTTG